MCVNIVVMAMDMINSEITVEVTTTRKKLFDILEKNGFFFKERLFITDYYYTHINISKVKTDFQTLSKNSVLVRNVVLERRYFSSEGITMLVYKKKDFNDEGQVQSEQKISCEIDSAPKVKRMFSAMGLKNWCTKKIVGYVYKKGSIEFLVQEIEGVGLFIEVEQPGEAKDQQRPKVNAMKKLIQDLKIPIKPDFHANIAYIMYLNQQKATVKKPVTKPLVKKPSK